MKKPVEKPASVNIPANPGKCAGAGTVNLPWYVRNYYPLLWFAITAFALYGRTLGFDYTYLDDHALVMGRMAELQSGAQIMEAFKGDVFQLPAGQGYYYRPVLTMSFMADANLGKGSFTMFHISNVLFHVIATWLLFLFLSRIGLTKPGAFAFSMLFLAHPLAVQAVAWVPGRNDSLLAIFILASFLCWIRYLDNGRPLAAVLHLLLFFLALLTKESAVAFPILVILFGLLVRKTSWKHYAMAGPAWVILLAAWWLMRVNALGNNTETSFAEHILSALTHIQAIIPFLGKAFFPIFLSVLPIMADMKIPMALGILALLAVAWLVLSTHPLPWRYLVFGTAWFVVFLVPSFVAVNTLTPNYAEHRVYLSLTGLIIILAFTSPAILQKAGQKAKAFAPAAVTVIFALLAFLHSGNFRNNNAFWQNAVETSPHSAFNYNNLGAMYYLADDLTRAEPLFLKALQLNPFEPKANANAGLVMMRNKRFDEAERYYLEEIRINPLYDNGYFNLGLLYYQQLKLEEAVKQWEKTIELNKYYSDAYQGLLQAYGQMQREGDYNRILFMARENGLVKN